jgi:ABC-type multidrug transport system ATPase subunit
MSSTEAARLEVRDVTKRFGSTLVLDGVDLTVLPGQALLLAGCNGSGKTTLLRCIAGLARYAGRVRLDGEPCGRSVRSRRRFGYLPQTPGLPPWATGLELLETFGRLRGTRSLPEAVPQGFLPPLTRPVATLSGGQRQRIAIAITLLGDPGLLLMDEPAANLDEEGRRGLAELVEAVRARGTSVVIASPSPGDLGAVPDRTVHLTDGRIQPEAAVRSDEGGAAPVTYLRPREVAG